MDFVVVFLMILFLMMILPLILILVALIYGPWIHDRPGMLSSLFWGLKAFVPGCLLYLLGVHFLKRTYTPGNLLFYHLFRDYLLWFFLALTGYGLLYSSRSKDYTRKTSEFLAYLLGFFLLTGVVDVLMRFGSYNLYSLFLLPLFRVTLIFGAAGLLGFWGRLEGAIQYLFLFLLLILTLPAGLSAMFFYVNHPFWSWLIAAICLPGYAALFVLPALKNRSFG